MSTEGAAEWRASRDAHDAIQRKFLADQYQNYANNIRLPDQSQDPEGYKKALDLKQQALDAMQKVYSPDHHATLAEHIHGLIFGPKQAQGAPQSSQAPTLPPTPVAASGQPTAPPATSSAHPFAHNPVYGDIIKGLDALGTHLKGFAQPNGPKQPLPALTRFATVPNDSELTAQDAAKKFQQEEELLKLKNQGALDVAKERGKNPTGRPVPFGRGSVSVKDAQELADNGQAFKDQDGNDIDVANLPASAKLTPWAWGNKIFYTIGDQVPRIVKADNLVTAQPEEGVLTPAAAVPSESNLGAERVPTERVTTQTTPGGAQVVTGTSRSTPVTPGTRPALTRPSSAPPRNTPKGPVSSSAPQFGGESILPNIQNMTPRNALMAQKAQPAVSALLGLYGDPSRPEVKSMADFAPLASDPHAQKVLGEAFKLLDQSMGEVSDPGIIQTLGTAAGWANFRAQAEAGAQQNAGTKMTDEEKEYFDTAIASMADIIGARSATGQSPARFSVKSIQNELPLIGTSSVTDPKQYLTKMLTISRQIQVGLNAMPDNARALRWLLKRENDLIKQSNDLSPTLNKKKPVSSQAPQPGGGKHKIGDKVKLKNGQTLTIKNVYPDGSFD